MDKIKILVACHKQAEVYNDKVYTPIQVGKALHPEVNLGYITDATGDNISNENPYYCELTALYWGWKNIDCKYIGLQHYRRYFNYIFDENNIDNVFKDCDIILGEPAFLDVSVFYHWVGTLIPEDIYVALKLLEALYPEDYAKGQGYFSNNIFYPCNMFVCKKELLDEFASWEFKYLEILKTKLKLSDYSREKRVLGFIEEGLLPIYFINRNYRIKTMEIVSYPLKGKKLLKTSMKSKIRAILKKKLKKRTLLYAKETITGLQQDGILDENSKLII